MVQQGIVIGHIISEKDIEVDKAKVELIFKLKLMWKIRRRPLSHVRLEHIPTEECLLVYAMHQQHSKDVFLVFSVIWWSELWRSSWMISPYMEVI